MHGEGAHDALTLDLGKGSVFQRGVVLCARVVTDAPFSPPFTVGGVLRDVLRLAQAHARELPHHPLLVCVARASSLTRDGGTSARPGEVFGPLDEICTLASWGSPRGVYLDCVPGNPHAVSGGALFFLVHGAGGRGGQDDRVRAAARLCVAGLHQILGCADAPGSCSATPFEREWRCKLRWPATRVGEAFACIGGVPADSPARRLALARRLPSKDAEGRGRGRGGEATGSGAECGGGSWEGGSWEGGSWEGECGEGEGGSWPCPHRDIRLRAPAILRDRHTGMAVSILHSQGTTVDVLPGAPCGPKVLRSGGKAVLAKLAVEVGAVDLHASCFGSGRATVPLMTALARKDGHAVLPEGPGITRNVCIGWIASLGGHDADSLRASQAMAFAVVALLVFSLLCVAETLGRILDLRNAQRACARCAPHPLLHPTTPAAPAEANIERAARARAREASRAAALSASSPWLSFSVPHMRARSHGR